MVKKNLVDGQHPNSSSQNHILDKEPPDGGTRAWMIMISAFLCNGVMFGIINTYSVIHSKLTDRLTALGDTEASTKAALVGSLTIGTTFLLSPVAGCLTDKIGLRLTTFIGGVLCAGGLFLSSFFIDNIAALYITYGIMFGSGAALAYTPTLVILGHYFKRYLGKVSGFVTAGSSMFTVILPPSMDYLVKNHGLKITLQAMAGTAVFIILCSLVYKPLHSQQKALTKARVSRVSTILHSIINVDNWKRKKYVIWTICVPLALFGYFVPYVHMVKFVQRHFPGSDNNLPVMSIGITSGVGRLIFGAIADMKGVNQIFLQQMALFFIGVMTILLPLTSSYVVLIIFSLLMGLFDGCFITLFGPIAFKLCGATGATQGIGFILGLSSFPLTIGPPVAGKLFELTGSYKLPFIISGIPPIVGAILMCSIHFIVDKDVSTESDEMENGDLKCLNNEGIKPTICLMNGNTSSNKSHATDLDGSGFLAETGTEKQTIIPDYGAALLKLKLLTQLACNYCSSPFLTNTSNSISPSTALLNSSSISTFDLDTKLDSSTENCSENSTGLPSRRYQYSTF